MRKLLAALVLLAVTALGIPSYGAINSGHYVLIYKGTLKSTKTLFMDSDVNNLISGSLQGYWAVDIDDANDANTATFGHVDDVNAVIFNTKDKEFKVIAGSVFADPCDPRKVVDMSYVTSDADGYMFFDMLGKGKLTKVYNADKTDANTLVKKFVPVSMNGTGRLNSFDTFDADRLEFFTGVGTLSLTLDTSLTQKYNSDGFTVDQAINDILITKLEKLTTRIPYIFVAQMF